ncbi:hypothetical protein [Candidatus Endomicrobiellum agilis]|uniref:hypothetical protein n=1 Tax=Candidatus Endomicrobiellum agilis TaxID=3238957 RepID=UPI0035A85343
MVLRLDISSRIVLIRITLVRENQLDPLEIETDPERSALYDKTAKEVLDKVLAFIFPADITILGSIPKSLPSSFNDEF